MVAGISGVQIGPGATLFARMPLLARDWARAAHMLAMPALVASYASSVGTGLSELTDELPMMLPPSGMCGTAALVRWKNADRLVAMVRFHSSSGMSVMSSRDIWNAALL